MNKDVLLALSLIVACAAEARGEGCPARVSRPSVGASAGMVAAGNRPDRTTFKADVWDDLVAERGFGYSVNGSIPLQARFVLRADAGTGRVSIFRKILDPQPPHGLLDRQSAGHLDTSHFTLAVVRYNTLVDAICPYAGGGIGRYTFSAPGARSRSGGVFGVVGMEFGTGRSVLGLELAIHAANNQGRAPLTEELAFVLRPSVVFRWHF
jgi:hypothetical protein